MDFAEAYRQAAMDFCHRLIEHESQRTWPNANVVLLLAAHSVELFLKGAILSREPEYKFGPGHSLDELQAKYERVFTSAEFRFEAVFMSDYPGISDQEANSLRAMAPPPSIQFRYPVSKNLSEWEGVHALEPETFFETLIFLGEEYERLAKQFCPN
ncbi:MAG: hypothetical protein KA505_09130 [Xanthomonadales bacterium]|nr:hypothetical protein [Xanthomonadales bacterium]